MVYRLPIIEDPPQRFIQNDGTIWERTGGCNRCGHCCGPGDPFKGTLGKPPVDGYCFYFSWESEGVGFCGGRHTDYYKNACAHWPGNRLTYEEHPECSYKFAPVESADKDTS